MLVAVLFIAFGAVSGVYAAAISNIVFFVIHFQNFQRQRRSDFMLIKPKIADGFNFIAHHAHRISEESGWWKDLETGQKINPDSVVPEKLCLIHSEISEAMEGHRKNLMDDKLPHRPMFEVELADAVIRIADIAEAMGLDVGGAIAEKMEFNASRPDHRPENRSKSNGKKY